MSSRLSDIADHAGVSTATVSRVLNGRSGVSATTEQVVLTSIDVLGYQRPTRLQQRSTALVGLVIPELDNPIFPMFAQVIESSLSQHGLTPLLCTRSPGGASEEEYVSLLSDHGVAGIIFVSGFHADTSADHSHYRQLSDVGLPLVMINGPAPQVPATFLSADDLAAQDLAVKHLVSLGHNTIGLAIGPERFVPSQRKVDGFRRAVARHLGESADAPIAVTQYSVEGGSAATRELLDAGCTAVICGSDIMALGAFRAARAADLRVPDDLSVIGYDDSPLMAYTDPPLTTLRQPTQAMGAAAVSALLDHMAGNEPPTTEFLFEPELVLRGSTGSGPRTRPRTELP